MVIIMQMMNIMDLVTMNTPVKNSFAYTSGDVIIFATKLLQVHIS